MKEMKTEPRNSLSCGESGDLQSAGQNLIIGGARLKDGQMIKEGINRFKKAGWPLNVIIMLAKSLIQEDRQPPDSSNK